MSPHIRGHACSTWTDKHHAGRSKERMNASQSVGVCMCYPSHTASDLHSVFLQCSCTPPSARHLMTLLYLCIKAQIQKHDTHWTHFVACFPYMVAEQKSCSLGFGPLIKPTHTHLASKFFPPFILRVFYRQACLNLFFITHEAALWSNLPRASRLFLRHALAGAGFCSSCASTILGLSSSNGPSLCPSCCLLDRCSFGFPSCLPALQSQSHLEEASAPCRFLSTPDLGCDALGIDAPPLKARVSAALSGVL